ncbi:hypothetical protein [Paenibacillus arenosi]|uniref:DUF4179 domain-containing protein n=1 Tax=Paenibacillus arenosi TaxID=2774142 RepID=A0ABR9B651_9BACL|nr:hypothetical protein [Paenibacillus arenosi]MBD8500930.1 hypothetical protein [Paenibacillus arenosi]
MPMEHKIREYLHKEAGSMECPPALTQRIEQSYSKHLQRKRSDIFMKKRLLGGMIAAAILIPSAVFAAPPLIELLTRTPMTDEQVKLDKVSKEALEKLYDAFPETKSFNIIEASRVEGDAANSKDKKAIQTSLVLQEKGASGKKIRLDIGVAGAIDHIDQVNWEPQAKPVVSLTEKEMKAKVDTLIDKMYGDSENYEFRMEQMENSDNKTFMLNYTKKGEDIAFFQVFVHSNTISLSLAGGGTAPAVDGFFSLDGKPDKTADYFLNDENLFALLDMSAAELKQEIAKGKTVVEIAAAKKVSKQQVVDVIATTQAKKQIQGDEKEGSSVDKDTLRLMKKAVEPKVVHIIEHKTETPWKK